MEPFVAETQIDYHEIIRRGGANGGDEDFAFIRFPNCEQIYLINYEVDTVYIDANDLSRRIGFYSPNDVIACVNCGKSLLAEQIWAALRSGAEALDWQVPWEAFRQSAWAWAAVFGDRTAITSTEE